MGEARQLALAFPHHPRLSEADFLPTEGNRQALEFLGNLRSWPQRRLALWGGRGAGKTHLLHIWARNHGAELVSGRALAGPVWPEGPMAVDDIDAVPSEPALLHLLNAAAEAGHPLLLASRLAPGRIGARLPDLASRLRAITAVEIGPADEPFLAALLARLLSDRQLQVAPSLQSWLLTRLPRTPGAIQEAVARLDRAALAAGSGVTRPLAAQALADLYPQDGIAAPDDSREDGAGSARTSA
jgi:chromosomal replication initiation ATPase DnaA